MPVKCVLSTLMGARRMKQSELRRATGLAKETVTNLYHDKATKIEYATLEKLCKALNCQPGDLLVYVPEEGEKR